MNMGNWISLREFARRREVALGAVQKAISSGRVTAVRRNGNGRLIAIDFRAATMEWNMNTDPDQAARASKSLEKARESMRALGSATSAPPADDAVHLAVESKDQFGYLAARAKREQFQAKQAELEYLKAIGLLVSADELQRINARRYKMLRDKFLNIGDRIATVVAAERDPVRVHTAITAEIKRVLNELSDDAATETAGGIAEGVAA